MKKITAILAALFIGSVFAFADPAEGYWISYDEKTNEATAGWYIYQKDGKALWNNDCRSRRTTGSGCLRCDKSNSKRFSKTGTFE